MSARLPLDQARLPATPAASETWSGLEGTAAALAVIQAARHNPDLTLVVARSGHAAQVLEQDLRLLAPSDLEIAHFPDWETLPYDPFSPHPDIISERLGALAGLTRHRRGILILPVSTLMQRLAPPSWILGNHIDLAVGHRIDEAALKLQLEKAGYEREEQVWQPGQYAVRGGLLDLYPMGSTSASGTTPDRQPLRIELFDDEIESIRHFDPETQLTTEVVDSVQFLPAREYPFDETGIATFKRNFRQRFEVDTRKVAFYQDVRQGRHPQGLEYYLPLFFDDTASLFEYLPEKLSVVRQAGVAEAARTFWNQLTERHEQRAHDLQHPVLSPGELYLTPESLREAAESFPSVSLMDAEESPSPGPAIEFEADSPPDVFIHEKSKSPGEALIRFVRDFDGRILLAAGSAGRRSALQDSLNAFGLHPKTIDSWQAFAAGEAHFAVATLPVSTGFLAHCNGPVAVLTEAQLYGGRLRQPGRRTSTERDPETIIRSLSELRDGVPIVHEQHGIGRYRGLNTLTIDDQAAEFLTIEYAKGDKLYVPVASLHLVSRYTGGSEDTAPLHRMGSDRWEKARKRAAKRVRDVAAELLDLYAKREARQGHAFELDRALYEEFAATFAYEETPDQLDAIEATIGDMTSARPMDRVICGDVGFGKTEVALRAAFVAAQANKQVAVLVPTTLLARQHHQTFADRFADWPVRIELLSRLSGSKAADRTLADLRDGHVDIVIGTHKLLSESVRFKDLGLVIVDEEQRFGVRQKERLKKLRAEVDLLTLTATPIPRTLNMAMASLRDLSIIATPPPKRVAVKTIISRWNDTVVREAIERELQRGGQVYFLHNKVENIQQFARELQELVPGARIDIAHGQMPKTELEQVMGRFYRQRINVLVCTTIIENGIDVPTANTILINRADHFGLAQLHQLRGRVGRSHHRAFAYLLVPHQKAMTADARKRLEAISSMEELGAGFMLASHDLEIRGAGELLGAEQSGQIEEVGLSMYTELLSRTVAAMKAGKDIDLEQPLSPPTEVDMHVPALIPDDYLPDVPLRLTLYKRIASAGDSDALRALKVEMIDRFGLLPEPVKNLFANAELRQQAEAIGLTRLELGPEGGRLEFAKDTRVEPGAVIKLIQRDPETYKLTAEQRLRVYLEQQDAKERYEHAGELLQRLAPRASGPRAA